MVIYCRLDFYEVWKGGTISTYLMFLCSNNHRDYIEAHVVGEAYPMAIPFWTVSKGNSVLDIRSFVRQRFGLNFGLSFAIKYPWG